MMILNNLRTVGGTSMLKITFFGTTTLLFDNGVDQIFFDAHFTRPSIEKYIAGAHVTTNTGL